MRRIGNHNLGVLSQIFTILFFLLVHTAQAQQVEFSATISDAVVFQGERITLTVTVSGSKFKKITNPELPEVSGLRYLSTTPSTSTSFSFVNGVATSSYGYSYYLLTEKEGEFTIPPVSITVDGKSYQTNPIKVVVRSRSAQSSNSEESPDIFLRMEVTNKNPYVGEQVIATVVIYFKNTLEILSYQPTAGWKAEGFWKEELNDGKQPTVTSDIINGVSYRKAELVKYALFATKSGKLTLSPFSVVTTVRVASRRRDPFSSFFGGYGTNQKNIDLDSDPLDIDVKSLPELKDAIYTGAVGSFKVSRSISKNDAIAGESIEVSTKIQGTGNIALVTQPEYEYPGTFEKYNPQQTSDINRRGDVVQGSKTFSDIIIPRTPGNYELAAVNYAIFNPKSKKFEIVRLSELKLNVKRDPRSFSTTYQQIPFEVQPVLGQTLWVHPKYEVLFRETWFIALLVIPFLLMPGLWYYRSYLDRMEGDVQFARSNKASRKADMRFKEAQKVVQTDIKNSYGLLYKALIGYVADRLHIPETGENEEIYINKLIEHGMSPEDITQLSSLLRKCSTIRFAPITSVQDFEKDFDIAQTLYRSIRRCI